MTFPVWAGTRDAVVNRISSTIENVAWRTLQNIMHWATVRAAMVLTQGKDRFQNPLAGESKRQ